MGGEGGGRHAEGHYTIADVEEGRSGDLDGLGADGTTGGVVPQVEGHHKPRVGAVGEREARVGDGRGQGDG